MSDKKRSRTIEMSGDEPPPPEKTSKMKNTTPDTVVDDADETATVILDDDADADADETSTVILDDEVDDGSSPVPQMYNHKIKSWVSPNYLPKNERKQIWAKQRCTNYAIENRLPTNAAGVERMIQEFIITKTAPVIQQYYGLSNPFSAVSSLVEFIQRTTRTGRYYRASEPFEEDTNSPLYKDPETVVDLEGNPLSIVYSVLKPGTILYKRANRMPIEGTVSQSWYDYSGRVREPGERHLPSFTRNVFGNYTEQMYVNSARHFGRYVYTARTTKPLLIIHFLNPFNSCDEGIIRNLCDPGNPHLLCQDIDGYTLDLMYLNPNDIWMDMEPMKGVREIAISDSRNLEVVYVDDLGYSYYAFDRASGGTRKPRKAKRMRTKTKIKLNTKKRTQGTKHRNTRRKYKII